MIHALCIQATEALPPGDHDLGQSEGEAPMFARSFDACDAVSLGRSWCADTTSRPTVERGEPVTLHAGPAERFGHSTFLSAFLDFVRKHHPGCVWATAPASFMPDRFIAYAILDGRIVGAVGDNLSPVIP